MNCNCMIHRFQAVHIVRGEILPDTELVRARMASARPEEVESFDSALYVEGMSAEDLRAAALEPATAVRR